MANASHSLLNYFRVMVESWRDDPRDDATLLARFAKDGDETAFQVLVGRHGPLVWQTCRRILGDTPDAEDAFQATFLALARKAGRLTIKNPAGWLHQVARQAALDARAGVRRRRVLEQRLRAETQPAAEEDASRAELYAVLDEELADLPERLRVPLVLRYLEGKTLAEVAQILGCSLTPVTKRLARGEAMLRQRLERRGMTMGVVSVGALLGSMATVSAVPTRLISSTARTAVAFRSGALTGRAAEAARAVLGSLSSSMGTTIMSMGTTAMRKSLWMMLACSLGLAGAALVTCQALSGRPDEPDEAGPTATQAAGQPGPGARAAARVDCLGDPLPAHALARMGTSRLWRRRGWSKANDTFVFSPDGKTLATPIDGMTVCLWDVATGKEIRRLTTEAVKRNRQGWLPPIFSLGFSPDGKMLVAVNWEQTVCFWETATGKFLRKQEYQGPKRDPVLPPKVAFLPGGKMLGFGGFQKSVEQGRVAYVWDVATGKEICQLSRPMKEREGERQTTAFSSDGKMLATTHNFGKSKAIISLWDVATGKGIRQLTYTTLGNSIEEEGCVGAVAFSPDSKTLASAANDEKICVWEVVNGKKSHLLQAESADWRSLTYSPDGETLLGELGEGEGHLWDVGTGKKIRSFGWKHVKVALFSPDGKVLAMGDNTGSIRMCEVATGKEVGPRKGYRGGIRSVAYSADGETLASLGEDEKTVRLWEVATGKEIRQLAKGSKSFAYSPDGKMLVSMDDVIHLWDTTTGKEIRQFQGRIVNAVDGPQAVAFSPDGKKVAAVLGGDRTIRLWEVGTGKQIYILPTRDQESNRAGNKGLLAFSPDGRMLATDDKDNLVSLWEVATGTRIGKLGRLKKPGPGEDFFVRFLAFSPDSRILATSSVCDDNKIRLWEVPTGKEIWQLDGYNQRKGERGPKPNATWEGCCSLAFSPDGRILATVAQGQNHEADPDREVHLWEVASGKEIGRLTGHQAPFRVIAFSPDGKTLVSGSDDLTCLVWDLTSFTGRLKPVPAPHLTPQALSKEQLEAAWADLAKEPAKAYAAFGALQAVPMQVIPLLQARLRPVAPVADPQKLKRWIADLDDNNFMVRNKARQEIERLGEPAIPALQQALNGRLSVEVRRRLKDLLAELEPKMVGGSPQRLRELRAVHLLEYLDTAESRQVLQAWAKGAAQACLTQEAQAALARLAKQRPGAKP